MKRDMNFVPNTTEEMCEHYFLGQDSPAASIIRTMMCHGTAEEQEDLLQAACLRAIEHNIIAKYDGEKGNFGGLVYVCVRSVVSNHLGKKSRNPVTGLCAGSIVENDEEFEMGQFQLSRVFAVDSRIDESLTAGKKLGGLYQYCKDRFAKPAHKRDRSLLPLFEMLALGEEPKDCAPKLGVTLSTVHNWMNHMKEVA